MDIKALLAQTQDSLTVRKVFGEPVDRDGATVIPVAKLAGTGGGGGAGEGNGGDAADAGGGGFASAVRPVGVYVVREGRVSWQPAVDVNRIVLGVQVIVVVALIVLRGIVRGRRRRT